MQRWGWEYFVNLVAKERGVSSDNVELNYSFLKFINIACYLKDKAEHDNAIAKEQLNKIKRNGRHR